MKVTARQLRNKRPCEGQLLIFTREWPKGVEITPQVLQRAVELELDLDWFAYKFLPDPAWEAYEKATAPAWEAYLKAKAPAWEAYEKATASAWEAYLKAKASAWEAYEKATVSALHQIIAEYGL